MERVTVGVRDDGVVVVVEIWTALSQEKPIAR